MIDEDTAMNVRERIAAIRLMEKIEKNPGYAGQIGLKASIRERRPAHGQGRTNIKSGGRDYEKNSR